MTGNANPNARVVTPMLAIRNAAQAIEFYKRAFGATELFRLTDPAGNIAHAEIMIGKTLLMMAEEHPPYNASPQMLGNSTVILHLQVENADAVVAQAVAAGAKIEFPVKDQFYGERGGRITDPFGHLWGISSHIEDVTPEEMQRRFDAMMAQQQ